MEADWPCHPAKLGFAQDKNHIRIDLKCNLLVSSTTLLLLLCILFFVCGGVQRLLFEAGVGREWISYVVLVSILLHHKALILPKAVVL